MLFQMHLKLDPTLPRSSIYEAFDAVEGDLIPEDDPLLNGAGSVLREHGQPVGFWSITEANEDPRIARVRQIAENLGALEMAPASADVAGDLRRALLAAIDGNPQEVQDASA